MVDSKLSVFTLGTFAALSSIDLLLDSHYVAVVMDGSDFKDVIIEAATTKRKTLIWTCFSCTLQKLID